MKKIIRIIALLLVLLLASVGCDLNAPSPESDTTDGAPAVDNSPHQDEDNNGFCDVCSGSVIVSIDFYAINDLHGKFADTDSNIGVDELTTYLKAMAEIDDNVVFLSSGDMWQGSSESNLTKGMIITEWMNHLDFASMTLGNHEYDWGEEFIEANADLAEFPFLAINIFDKDDNERVDYCSASVVIERDGIQIGIIGAVGDCYSSISGEKTEGIYFKTGPELTSLVKAESERLRAQGVDYIVYSIHDGYEKNNYSATKVENSELYSYYNAALSGGYVDLVFEGHTHQRYVLIDEYGVYHLQNGGENKGISHVEIKINSVNNNSTVTEAEFISSSVYSGLDDDTIVNDLLEKYSDDIEKANIVLGANARKRTSNEIKQLVSELYLKYGSEKWADEYSIVLGGGFISTRSPYDIAAGEVRYRDVQSVLPFDNTLVLCSIQGRYLISQFLETDNKNYYISLSEYGEDIKNDIDPNATYYIVTDTYSSQYAPNHLSVIEEYDNNVFARDLVAEYVKNGGWTSKN